jgi:hypothetical protein
MCLRGYGRLCKSQSVTFVYVCVWSPHPHPRPTKGHPLPHGERRTSYSEGQTVAGWAQASLTVPELSCPQHCAPKKSCSSKTLAPSSDPAWWDGLVLNDLFCSKLSTPHLQPAFLTYLGLPGFAPHANAFAATTTSTSNPPRPHPRTVYLGKDRAEEQEDSQGLTSLSSSSSSSSFFFSLLVPCSDFALTCPCIAALLCSLCFALVTISPRGTRCPPVFFVCCSNILAYSVSPVPSPRQPQRPEEPASLSQAGARGSQRPPQVDPDVDWPHALSSAQHISTAASILLLNTKLLRLRVIANRPLPPSKVCRLQLPRAVKRAFPRDSALRVPPSLPYLLQPGLPKVELARNLQTW